MDADDGGDDGDSLGVVQFAENEWVLFRLDHRRVRATFLLRRRSSTSHECFGLRVAALFLSLSRVRALSQNNLLEGPV